MNIVHEKDLLKLAQEILELKPQIIALEGQLGAGKTTFTKALAKTLGIVDTIVSPTFVLHREYPNLDHIDLWRLESFTELEQLGLKNMIKNKRTIVLEWADKFRKEIEDLQINTVWLKFEHTKNENERKVIYENISH